MNYKTRALFAILLAWLVLAGSSALAQTWSQLVTTGSPPSVFTNVANYDSTNNRLIVFLPRGGTLASDQVWVLTNANGLGGTPTWTQLQPTGTAPNINWGASAVYDAPANQLIVYGGCSGNCGSVLSDVYVLSHANGLGGTPAWSQSSPTSAIAREQHSAIYDPRSNSMIMFGGGLGFYGTDQNDTNVLFPANGGTPAWTTLAPSGGPPGDREGASAVYDTAHNLMIVFGGTELIHTCCPYEQSDYNDVWRLSNANGRGGTPTWTQVTPQGTPPPPRGSHSAVYDSSRNVMYVFGGGSWFNDTQSVIQRGDVWRLTNANGLGVNPTKWTQVGQLGTPPGGTSWHGAGFDKVNQRLIVFGGRDRYPNANNLTFVLDLLQH